MKLSLETSRTKIQEYEFQLIESQTRIVYLESQMKNKTSENIEVYPNKKSEE